MMEQQKDRQTYLDSAAGVLLIYMIVYHCAQWAGIGPEFIRYTMALSFFMPWFFFKAGMFYRRSTLADNLHKSSRRLLIPWLIWGVVGTAVYFIIMYARTGEIPGVEVMRYIKNIVLRGAWQGNIALWFLFSLCAVRIIYGVIEPLRHSRWYISGISLLGFAMYYLVYPHLTEKQMLNLPYYVSNVSIGMMYFALGHWLRNWHIPTQLLVVLSLTYIAAILLYPSYVFMYENKVFTGNYTLAMVYSLTGIICINGWMLRYAGAPNLLSRIGADTMPFYCMHWIIIVIVAAFITGEDSMTKFVTLISANILLLPLLTWAIRRTKIKYIFG